MHQVAVRRFIPRPSVLPPAPHAGRASPVEPWVMRQKPQVISTAKRSSAPGSIERPLFLLEHPKADRLPVAEVSIVSPNFPRNWGTRSLATQP